jgi:hypothetical protein
MFSSGVTLTTGFISLFSLDFNFDSLNNFSKLILTLGASGTTSI